MDWRLLLVGTGELQPLVIAQLNKLGLGSRVRILPPETDVGHLLMEAQIFVLSTHFEALPISILEAMRAGMPVLATDVGGISEAVRHKETGLLVHRGDILGLRDALASMIADPTLRLTMGTAGRSCWTAQFTATTMATKTLEVYRRAMAVHA
jgi:glycosyltransferase involved in cell wall biosynthesis